MKPTDKFTITPKVTGTMKVKTSTGRTIPFTLLNCNLLLTHKLSFKSLGLLAIAESIGSSNGGSFSAIQLSYHSSDPMEALLAALVELQVKGCIKRVKEDFENEKHADKKNAANRGQRLTAKV